MEYGELEVTERTGGGAFGVVYQGFWNTKKAGKISVAIKNLPHGDLKEVCMHVQIVLCFFILRLSGESVEFTAAFKLHSLLRLCQI